MWNLAFIVSFMTVTSIFQIQVTSLLFHAFVATILVLCVQVAHRKGRSVLWDLELYCHRKSYRKCQYIVRCLADAFTSDQDMEKRKEISTLTRDYTKAFDALLQRDLYLRDKRYILSDSSNHDEEALEEANKEIDRIWVQMCVNARNPADSYRLYRDEPVWVRDYPMVSLSHHFKNSGELECMMRFGCCFSNCGCCKKPRRDMKGEMGAVGRGSVHCTVECGCCIQRRGFRLPEEEMGEESTQTENWELD